MNKSLLTLAAVALVSASAFAGEADPSGQFALQTDSTRTRAEVKAEAVAAVARGATRPSNPHASASVQPPLQTSVEARVVRAQTAEAVRLGQISYGEQGSF